MLIIYILTGWKIKVTAKLGLKFLRIHCQNFALIMTNEIRKVRQGVDIFLFLVSSSRTVLQNKALSTVIFSLQPAENKPVS